MSPGRSSALAGRSGVAFWQARSRCRARCIRRSRSRSSDGVRSSCRCKAACRRRSIRCHRAAGVGGAACQQAGCEKGEYFHDDSRVEILFRRARTRPVATRYAGRSVRSGAVGARVAGRVLSWGMGERRRRSRPAKGWGGVCQGPLEAGLGYPGKARRGANCRRR